MSPLIRPATPDDADALCDVHVASIRGLCSAEYTPAQIAAWTAAKHPDHYRRFMSQGERFYLALAADGKPAGLASHSRDNLTTLYVHPAHVRQGVGSALLATVEQSVRHLGHAAVHTHATLNSLPFYLRHGYAQHESHLFRLTDGTQLPCVRMSKPLTNLTLRPGTPDDAERIHQIHTDSLLQLCSADYTPEQLASWTRFRSVADYRRALESGETNLLACLPDATIVGYATYVAGELTALFVDPAHARHGAGRLLLAAVESHARSQGLHTLTLQSTLTSQAFYERQGYTASAPEHYTLPDGVRIACVRMSKRI